LLVLGLGLTACAVPDGGGAAYLEDVPVAYAPVYAPASYTVSESRGCGDCGAHHHHTHHRSSGGGGKSHKHKRN
jgi:hypothetical protein